MMSNVDKKKRKEKEVLETKIRVKIKVIGDFIRPMIERTTGAFLISILASENEVKAEESTNQFK